jgi:dTDP-4-dehydrorhamnose reductase
MNVAIVGSSGYISNFLIQRFEKESHIQRILKLDQTDEADAYFNLLTPEQFDYSQLKDIDYVVFTAAISGPDRCADEFEECWKINVTGTEYFIRKAMSQGCKVLFFSSDAVFGDIPGYIYDENSETQAATPYGRMKKAIEDRFKAEKKFKCIRLSYVASAKDRFALYCKSCMQKGEVADVFHPFYRNCIVVSDVVDVVVWFSQHWDEYNPFVLNVAGKELVSRVRIADEINRMMNGQLKYSISFPEGNFYKNRPKITQMKSLYLQKYHILEDNTFTEKIQKEWNRV